MKISVAMCTYNGARYLRQQLESIATQTRPPYEIVVCDDGSQDETVSIVENFALRVSFPIRLHLNAINLGSTRSFDRSISLCAGDVIALCDQDDVWLPGKLERVELEFIRDPDLGLVFTDAEVVDEELRPIGYSLWQKLELNCETREQLRTSKAIDELLQGSTVTGATLAFRSRFKPLVLPIPNDLPLIHDAWIALVIALVSKILPLAEPLVKYRQHGGQQVGAVERKSVPSGFLPHSPLTALRRENPYAEMLAVALSVRSRALDRLNEFDSGKAIELLDARIAHLTMRSSLPPGLLRRIPRVLRELLTRRYHLYSKGIFSALKDLLA